MVRMYKLSRLSDIGAWLCLSENLEKRVSWGEFQEVEVVFFPNPLKRYLNHRPTKKMAAVRNLQLCAVAQWD